MKYLRWLLMPFSLLYGLVVIMRNWLYDAGLLKSYRFTKPVISVGNLDVGGAGKSPMTEHLIRLLKPHYQLATLSRGYGRRSKGYLEERGASQESRGGEESQESRIKSQEGGGEESQESRIKSQEAGGGGGGGKSQGSRVKSQEGEERESQESRVKNQELEGGEGGGRRGGDGDGSGARNQNMVGREPRLAERMGDEPAQFCRKFPDITVAVCEDRVVGINRLIGRHDVILMDDAFQHRSVTPGLSILLFDYNRIHEPHLSLPAGNLREPFSGRWRAQIIVITKCPPALTHNEQEQLAYKIEPLPYQQLFFSSIGYQSLRKLDGAAADNVLDEDTTVFLLTGIANPQPLVQHLRGVTRHIIHHNYADHHPFTLKNITKLAAEFEAHPAQKKLIVTTEKDAQRLEESWFARPDGSGKPLPVFVLPIQVDFLEESGSRFDQIIINYVREHTTDHSIH